MFAPGDPGYDEARTVFNAMIDRRPAVIAQCADATDVVRAVRFGRELDLHIAVRGGGHSVAGTALGDGALVVDLRRMHQVTVDPAAEAVRIEGGATMSHLDRATQPYGLATTGGRASTTGVGGFVLGGGTGWLDRAFGLAVDNLIAVELVTADAERVHASADENPELFWALHGGGGNFGVATALTLRLHELPEFSLVLLMFLPRLGPDVLHTFREIIRTGPDEVGGAVLYLTGPTAEFYAPGAGGHAAVRGPADLRRRRGRPAQARRAAALRCRTRWSWPVTCRTPTCSACSISRRACGTTGRRSICPGCRTRRWTPSAPARTACRCRPPPSICCSRRAGRSPPARTSTRCPTGTPPGRRTRSRSGPTRPTTSGR